MTHTITVLDENHARIELDYRDEGVNLLTGQTVRGDEAAARRRLPQFDRDVRHNFAELFPPPPEPEPVDGEEIA